MNHYSKTTARRLFLQRTAFLSAAMFTRGLFADELAITPSQTEGPFYPDHLPLDTDNDLLILNDALTPAVGQITHLMGRVLSHTGQPLRNAVVEIWQADSGGCYLHSGSSNRDQQDKGFQGFGRFLTSSKGEYYFRTIKPVSYPGRTPHIHFAVNYQGKRILTTQCYIKGHPQNDRDGVLRGTKDSTPLMVDWTAIESSRVVEYNAHFDMVLGTTPDEAEITS